jgi:hypothetical protein
MLVYGTNIMKCVVVGNSPNIQDVGSQIDDHDVVIRTGRLVLEGYENQVGSKTDMLVTRTNKYKSYEQFFYRIDLPEVNKPQSKDIILLGRCSCDIDIDLLSNVDNLVKLNSKEKPTLGLIAVILAISMFGRVNVCGIEMDVISEYHTTGHYDDLDYMRVNDYHSLVKEVLYYNKLLRQGIITRL